MMDALLERLSLAESRLRKVEDTIANANHDDCDNTNNNIDRIRSDIIKKQIYSYNFLKVSNDYYQLSLQERANQLKCSIPQLCKSILFENTAYYSEPAKSVSNGQFDVTNSQYYLVIVQYIGEIVHKCELFSLSLAKINIFFL